jgi:predicted nucleic acid-binding protein
MAVFVDTSALYAAFDRGDSSHSRAVDLLSREEARVTSDHVIVELWLLTKARAGFAIAESSVAAVRTGGVEIESILLADLEAAWETSRAFIDQTFSLVDRTSFAVMERLGLNRVVSFDDDFAIYRYGPRRDRAFELLR